MNVEEIIIKKVIEVVIDRSINFFNKVIQSNKENSQSSQTDMHATFSAYVKKALNFAENISIFRMPDKHNVEDFSIELNFQTQDRRFFSENSKEILDEEKIIEDNNHYILLGDPGAGKTTTLKRLIKKIFLKLFSDSEGMFYTFPIVVRLGEIQNNESLLLYICDLLGIEYTKEKKIITFTESKCVTEDYYDKNGQMCIRTKEVEIEKERIIYEYKMGSVVLKHAMGQYLNSLNCIVFLDGLDELHFQIRDQVFEEIKYLSQVLTDSKLVLSSRYIEEIPTFKQFRICEIIPLDKYQKEQIANLWIDNTNFFFNKLDRLPYKDLADRPLFLTYLVRLFRENNEELPKQAVDIYRQIVLLAIKEWDMDKEVEVFRYSRYKQFDTYKKEDFLSELTFDLTYNQGVKKVFTHKQLEQSYDNIYSRYPGIESYDSTGILKDIEAHNGLVIEMYGDRFEFSHLSLQEYLCAKYILAIPFSRKYYELINIYPAPIAIANVLSPKPEEFFAMIFLNNIGEIRNTYQLKSEKIYEFLDRLIIEKIVFSKPKLELGLALLFIMFKMGRTPVADKILQFTKIKFIYESLQLCFSLYEIKRRGGKVELKAKKNLISDLYISFPEAGTIDNQKLINLFK